MKILKQNDEETLITEKEFLSILNYSQEKGSKGMFLPRLQEYISFYRISNIVPVPGQLEFGKPYLLISEDGKSIADGRYFVNKDGIVLENSGLKHGKYVELKDRLLSEDEYYDDITRQSKTCYPNNLISENQTISLGGPDKIKEIEE